jgi:hypothetical protein
MDKAFFLLECLRRSNNTVLDVNLAHHYRGPSRCQDEKSRRDAMIILALEAENSIARAYCSADLAKQVLCAHQAFEPPTAAQPQSSCYLSVLFYLVDTLVFIISISGTCSVCDLDSDSSSRDGSMTSAVTLATSPDYLGGRVSPLQRSFSPLHIVLAIPRPQDVTHKCLQHRKARFIHSSTK